VTKLGTSDGIRAFDGMFFCLQKLEKYVFKGV
jgi:hypothetical protein